jgi:hypothetical protein
MRHLTMLRPHHLDAIRAAQPGQIDPGQHGRQLRPRRQVRQACRNRQPCLFHGINVNKGYRQNSGGDVSQNAYTAFLLSVPKCRIMADRFEGTIFLAPARQIICLVRSAPRNAHLVGPPARLSDNPLAGTNVPRRME